MQKIKIHNSNIKHYFQTKDPVIVKSEMKKDYMIITING